MSLLLQDPQRVVIELEAIPMAQSCVNELRKSLAATQCTLFGSNLTSGDRPPGAGNLRDLGVYSLVGL